MSMNNTFTLKIMFMRANFQAGLKNFKYMKTKIAKLTLVLCFAVCSMLPGKGYSQLDIMGQLVSGGVSDAEQISEAYLTPFIDAFGANLNSGWYNTAKPHNLLGFDITISFNTAVVPSVARSYDLSALELTGEGDGIAPTFSGKRDDNRPELAYHAHGYELTRFKVPNGTGVGYIPTPVLQAGVGLPFDTDIIVRYLPNIEIGSTGKMGLYGFGIKHSIKQWLPVIDRIPIINLSIMGGYTNFNTSSAVNVSPELINENAIDMTSDDVSFDNQEIVFDVNSYTANLIGSIDIPFFVVYGSVGFAANTANLKMLGYYPIPTVEGGEVVFTDDSVGGKDPIDFTVQGDANKYIPRYNIGMTFKLGLFHLNFDYTYAHYSVASAGIAFSFR